MPGPVPKDPAVRRRRNKASTHSVLESPADHREPPPLPAILFPGSQPHELTVNWWHVIWQSPMASRWLESDVQGLYLVAVLRNEFFMRPTPTLAGEIRQQESRFGLDVLARRRLDWKIGGAPIVEEPEHNPMTAPDEPKGDPRALLRAVK